MLQIACAPTGLSLPLRQRQTYILQLNGVFLALLSLIKNAVLEPAITCISSFQVPRWQWSSLPPILNSLGFSSHFGWSHFDSQVSVATKNLLCLHIQNRHPNWNKSKVSDKLLGHAQLLSFFPFIYVVEGPFAICFNFLYRVKLSLTPANSHFTPTFPDLSHVALFADLFFFLFLIQSYLITFLPCFSLCKICLFQIFFAPLTQKNSQPRFTIKSSQALQVLASSLDVSNAIHLELSLAIDICTCLAFILIETEITQTKVIFYFILQLNSVRSKKVLPLAVSVTGEELCWLLHSEMPEFSYLFPCTIWEVKASHNDRPLTSKICIYQIQFSRSLTDIPHCLSNHTSPECLCLY